MEELEIEFALKIIQRKIRKYIDEYRGNDKKEFLLGLRNLIKKRNEIYKNNRNVINKVLYEYVKK